MVEQNQIDRTLIQKSLFLFESGSNDIFDFFVPTKPPMDPEAYVKLLLSSVTNFVEKIYSLGARRIVLFSLGPVGCSPGRAMLPGSPTDRCDENINAMVRSYNHGLEEMAKHIHINHPGSVGTYAAVYDIVHHFRIFPRFFGK
jgi:hypothetical protein